MRRFVWVSLSVLALGCGSSTSGGSGTGGNGGGGGAAPQSLVNGLRVSEVSIYQGLKIPLEVEGVPVDPRPTPVVQGREALLRVFVQPNPDWQPREVIVRLELSNSQGLVGAQEIRRVVNGGSVEADFMSAFNFDVAATDIAPDTTYSVGIYEVEPSQTAPSPGSRFPETGVAWLGALDDGPQIKMVLVPVQWNADGSGRLQDVSEAQVEKLRQQMYKMYPVRKVDIRVREPLSWNQNVSAFGQGWGELLQTVLYWRQDDLKNNVASDDEYYYGMFNPSNSFFSYCQQGCVAGLSSGSVSPKDSFLRGSIGLGYPGEYTAGTFVHETGHAHGRLHAPCAPFGQIQSVDPAFPYGDGGIGTWGYDLLTHQLIDPGGASKDMMGYCDPTWISDYTYTALFNRIAAVNGVADVITLAPQKSWQTISIAADGSLAVGVPFRVRGTPDGEPREVEVTGPGGSSRTVTGYFYPYSHIPGGMVLIPEPQEGDRAVRIGGRHLAL